MSSSSSSSLELIKACLFALLGFSGVSALKVRFSILLRFLSRQVVRGLSSVCVGVEEHVEGADKDDEAQEHADKRRHEWQGGGESEKVAEL